MTATPSSILVWERERARVSHDLLKNEFIPLLSKAIRIIQGKVQDDGFEATIPDKVLGMGAELSISVSTILDSMATSISPAAYLDCPPLSNLDEDSKEWLSELIEGAWMRSYGIDRLQNEVRCLVEELTRRIGEIGLFPPMSSGEKLSFVSALLDHVRDLSVKLAKLRSAIPYSL
jgi:hypothetical protein